MRNAAWLALLAGCALTSRTPPRVVRYFAPADATAPAPRACRAGAAVRLGAVTSIASLRDRIVHRDSAVEVAPYATLRWTERPDAYVRRALIRALYDARGVAETVGGAGPTLEVEVLAFEELRAPRRAGRVRLSYALRDDRVVLARGVVTVEEAAAGASIDAVVPAIGKALDAAVDQVAERVARQVCDQS